MQKKLIGPQVASTFAINHREVQEILSESEHNYTSLLLDWLKCILPWNAINYELWIKHTHTEKVFLPLHPSVVHIDIITAVMVVAIKSINDQAPTIDKAHTQTSRLRENVLQNDLMY